MPNRTFSFRAPPDFGDRVRQASVILDDLATEGGTGLEQFGRQLALALCRDSSGFHRTLGNQSAFVRKSVGLIIDAAEKVASDHQYALEYMQVERTDDEAEFHRAALDIASRRWR